MLNRIETCLTLAANCSTLESTDARVTRQQAKTAAHTVLRQIYRTEGHTPEVSWQDVGFRPLRIISRHLPNPFWLTLVGYAPDLSRASVFIRDIEPGTVGIRFPERHASDGHTVMLYGLSRPVSPHHGIAVSELGLALNAECYPGNAIMGRFDQAVMGHFPLSEVTDGNMRVIESSVPDRIIRQALVLQPGLYALLPGDTPDATVRAGGLVMTRQIMPGMHVS